MPISWTELQVKQLVQQICEDFDKEVLKHPIDKIKNKGVIINSSIQDNLLELVKSEVEKVFNPQGWKLEVRPTGFEPMVPIWAFVFMPVEI